MVKNTISYKYYIKDHLGNNRVVADHQDNVMQYTHYYPYGGILYSSTEPEYQKFKYNGKEYDSMHGLNEYDYGARQYDPAIARFTSMDPLCEKYYHISPYSYCGGNPVNRMDPDGKDPIYAYVGRNIFKKGKLTQIGDDGNKNNQSYFIVNNRLSKKIAKSASSNGGIYNGELSESDKIVHIPGKNVYNDIMCSFSQTEKSGRENGGHALLGEKNAIMWDEGPAPTNVIDENGNQVCTSTIDMFKVNGKGQMPLNTSNIKIYWHIHPTNSTPTDPTDFRVQENMEKRGYKGSAIILCVGSKTVTFYNSSYSIIEFTLDEFSKMSKQ